MNINAGTNQYNLSLKKMKEEKRPTFATIFDKLDARSKKLNPKNPLNAVMTNEQMYRYYLEETEPMLREAPDDYDLLDDVIGGKSLKDMKLSEFAKLLSGELESNRNVKYETLTATITPTPAAPIVPSSITITTPPSAPAPVAPAPVAPPSGSAPAPVAPPSGSAPPPSAPPSSAPAPVAPPSGSAPAPVAPPSGSAPAPVAPPSAPSAPAAAPSAPPAAAPSAAPAGSGLSVAIPPAGSGGVSTPTGSTAGGVISGIASAASGLLSSAKSLLSSPKPPTGGPSGTSVPTSAVASAATTAPATGVPTATPASGAATPAGGGSGTGTAAGGVSPSAVASSLVSGDEGNYNIWFKGTITGINQLTYNNALKAGLSPPKVPDDIKTDFSSTNLKWVNHIKTMNDYNELLQRENKDTTGQYSFSFTKTQENLIRALKANGNDAQVVFEGIKDKSIELKDYEPKPPVSKPPVSKPAGGGGAKSGKGGKKKK
jgi:hypothetical protein